MPQATEKFEKTRLRADIPPVVQTSSSPINATAHALNQTATTMEEDSKTEDSASECEEDPQAVSAEREKLGDTVHRMLEVRATEMQLINVGVVHTRSLSLQVTCSRCQQRLDAELLPETPVC